MSFPRYERYKDSGVEWLGEVPEHWTVAPVRSIVQHLDNRNEGAECQNYLSLMANIGVMPYAEKGDIGNKKPEDLSKCKVVRTGNIVINSMNYNIGSYGMSRYDGICSPVYVVLEINEAVILPRFGFRIFQNTAFQRYAASFGNGILAHRAAIGWDELKIIGIAVPPKEEQQTILAFLDDETLKIDALIEEQQRLIDLLKEKRQAVISHAVTKGLNPEVPLRDSGIEWLGEIPAHWSVEALKRAFSSMDYGVSESLDSEGAVAILRMGNIQDGRVVTDDLKYVDCIDPALILREGDLLYNRTNSLDLIGKVGMFMGGLDLPVSFASYLVRLRTVEDSIPAYFAYLLNTEGILGIARANAFVAIGQCNLNPTRYGQIFIALPPLNEQREVVKYLDRKTAQIAVLREEAEAAITILLERRSALISAAVTGKIDVRADIAKPVLSATQYSSGFAHQLLAAEILDRYNSQRMGRIKLQKLIHLCEYHGQVSELQGDYSRNAAGPFDARAMAGISKNLKKQKWFEEVKEGERYVYRPLEKRGEHKKYLAHWQAEMPRIDEVLRLLGAFKTRECEIVSTLYAAWNDLLIDGGSTDDAAILHEASSAERWHKSKEQIAPERWKKALQWMKDKSLVPVGYGKHTRHAAGQIGTTTEEAHEPA